MTGVAERWWAVRARVDAACREAGRDPAEVAILPVSKTFGVPVLREALAAGLRRFGENRMQEIRDKQAELADADIAWVVIGPLQTNKARDAARLAAEVQSLDRLALAEALQQRLEREGRTLDVLVQVKTALEPGKHGLPPAELLPFLDHLRALPRLHVRGLMTVATQTDDAGEIRRCFRQLRQLRDAAVAIGHVLPRLSMGMSGDFPLAIAEGATELRIGSGVFALRPAAAG